MAKGGKQNLKQEGKIFGKWIAIARAADGLADGLRADVFRNAKQLVAEKINTACGNDEALSSYDAEIFDCYMRIIGAYSKVVGIYLDEEKPITSQPVKEIWDGVYEVLASRLLAISEMDHLANPVQAEKKEIVSKIILDASERILENDAAEDNIEIRRRLFYADDNFQTICEEIAENIKSKCINEFYATYISAVKQALVNLNDISCRENVLYYNDMLKEEQDILRQIIVVQVMALENAMGEGFATEEEIAVLDEALNLLREAHQRESGEIDRIERLFNESAARNRENMGRIVMDVEDVEEFAASFDAVAPTVFEESKQSLDKAIDDFKKLVESLASAKLGTYTAKLSKQAADDCEKTAAGLVMMSRDVTQCFGTILRHYDENTEHLAACEEKDIIKGVAETILIKIDSLNEAIEAFEEDAKGILGLFAQGEMAFSSEITAFEKHLVDNLMTYSKWEKNCGKIVKKLVDAAFDGELLAEYKEKLERGLVRKSEGAQKKMMAFKRDNLFYELSTFEEIMHYSVSRLRESESPCLQGFVSEIDSQNANIDDILTKYGVEKIAPAAHDAFNPKENEVLMAEESEGFNKGEIIKTINSGYRQDGTVIMRANVIAAK
ncbi:MAG: nucleotide exchange factor GrpE [Defluviitaleaceae bacterium]|nr:nucleotide exchange factor GrpE [Defluviitaleaceae bacterium]